VVRVRLSRTGSRLEKATIAEEFGSSGDAQSAAPGGLKMKRFFALIAIAAVAALGGWALTAPARAAPPTVTPSPGYDARLQQQHAAQSYDEPAAPIARPVSRRHVKRVHHSAQ
jgi:hypothetical protein